MIHIYITTHQLEQENQRMDEGIFKCARTVRHQRYGESRHHISKFLRKPFLGKEHHVEKKG